MKKFNFVLSVIFASIGVTVIITALYYLFVVLCTEPPYEKAMTWLTHPVAVIVVGLITFNLSIIVFKRTLRALTL